MSTMTQRAQSTDEDAVSTWTQNSLLGHATEGFESPGIMDGPPKVSAHMVRYAGGGKLASRARLGGSNAFSGSLPLHTSKRYPFGCLSQTTSEESSNDSCSDSTLDSTSDGESSASEEYAHSGKPAILRRSERLRNVLRTASISTRRKQLNVHGDLESSQGHDSSSDASEDDEGEEDEEEEDEEEEDYDDDDDDDDDDDEGYGSQVDDEEDPGYANKDSEYVNTYDSDNAPSIDIN